MNRRGFLQGLLTGAASVAVGLRLSHGTPKLVKDDFGWTTRTYELNGAMFDEISRKRAEALAAAMKATQEQMAADILNRAFSG